MDFYLSAIESCRFFRPAPCHALFISEFSIMAEIRHILGKDEFHE